MPRKRNFNCKIVVVGDHCTNKTGLLISYTSGSYPTDYMPTVFDNFTAHLRIDDIDVAAGLWDTAGAEDYDSLRPHSYPQTDIFLLLFAIDKPETFKNAKERWFAELQTHCPTTPILLVGVNHELRNSTANLVSYEQGQQLAKEIGAAGYYECSAKTGEHVNQVFDIAIRHCLTEAGFYKQQNQRSLNPSFLRSLFIFINGTKELLFQAPAQLNEPVITAAPVETANLTLLNQTRSHEMTATVASKEETVNNNQKDSESILKIPSLSYRISNPASSEIAIHQLKEMINLPNSLDFGKAKDNEDCFFEALAQALNMQSKSKIYTAKLLRQECHGFFNKSELNKQCVMEWLQKYGAKETEEDYQFVQYNQSDLDQDFNKRPAIWGRPSVEGRIIIEALDLEQSIYITDVSTSSDEDKNESQAVVYHYVISKEGIKQLEEKDNIYSEKQLHLMVHNFYFKPLLSAQAMRELVASSLLSAPAEAANLHEQSSSSKPKVYTSGVDLASLQKHIKESYSQIEAAKDKDVCLVIGDTGVGKTSITHYMLGRDFELKDDEDTNNVFLIPKGDPIEEIGHGNTSKTFFPKIYCNNTGVAYCDCPGFKDTRTEADRICVAINTQLVVKIAKSVRAIIVIITPAMFANRGTALNEFIKTLSLIIDEPSKSKKSILFVMNQYPLIWRPKDTYEIAYNRAQRTALGEIDKLEDTIKQNTGTLLGKVFQQVKQAVGSDDSSTNSEIETYKKQLKILKLITKDNFIIADICDDGLTRKEIDSFINTQSKHISTHELDFSRHDDRLVKFNEAIYNACSDASEVIKQCLSFPAQLLDNKKQLIANLKGINFYKHQIAQLENGIPLGKHKQALEEHHQKLANTLNDINENTIRKDNNLRHMMSLNDERKSLDTSTSVKHWERIFHSEGWSKWQVALTILRDLVPENTFRSDDKIEDAYVTTNWFRPVVVFDYKGPPPVSIYKGNCPLEDETAMQNGLSKLDGKALNDIRDALKILPPIEGVFEDIEQDFETARYKTQFVGHNAAKDIDAIVAISVAMNTLPENAIRIRDIDKDLELLRQAIDTQMNLITRLEKEKVMAENNIKECTSESRKDFEDMIVTLSTENNLLETQITEQQKLLEEAATKRAENADFYKTLLNIVEVLKLQSALVVEFQKLNEKLAVVEQHQPQTSSIVVDAASSLNDDYGSDEDDVPDNYLCPINMTMFKEPVVTLCGHSFEKEDISLVRDSKNPQCPLCYKDLIPGQIDKSYALRPNYALLSAVDSFRQWRAAKKQLLTATSVSAIMAFFAPGPTAPANNKHNNGQTYESKQL